MRLTIEPVLVYLIPPTVTPQVIPPGIPDCLKLVAYVKKATTLWLLVPTLIVIAVKPMYSVKP